VDNGDIDVNSFWHQKYGHLSFQHLSILSKLEMEIGLPSIQKKEGM
jgi:hypothetical protein